MNMMQQETGDRKEYGYGNLDAEIPTDDEELGYDTSTRQNVRDEQTLLNTQREDWLLSMEPLHGACMGLALDRPVGSALQ